MHCVLLPACAAIAAIATTATAQEAEVDPGDRPEFFLGNWTVRGDEESFSETCRLLTPNSFVICEGEITDPTDPYKWVSLRGYSHFDDLYTYSEFGGDGSIYHFNGWLNDGVWTFVSHRQYEQRVVRIEDTMTPTEAGFVLRRRISINGGEWETRFEEEHVRLHD